MKIETILKATVPVILGVFVAGYLMHALSDIPVVDNARRGYDR